MHAAGWKQFRTNGQAPNRPSSSSFSNQIFRLLHKPYYGRALICYNGEKRLSELFSEQSVVGDHMISMLTFHRPMPEFPAGAFDDQPAGGNVP